MKIRKLKIKNYKIFKDVEFDFTDKNGNTLNSVVLAGINGTGKTTLIELIVKLLHGKGSLSLSEFPDLFVELEVEFSEQETKEFKLYLEDNKEDIYQQDRIFTFKNKNLTIYLEFSGDHIIDKHSVGILSDFITKTKNKIKTCYFPDLYIDFDRKSTKKLKIFDFETVNYNLEKYFEKVITRFLFNNRDVTTGEVIKKQIDKINNTLKGIKTISKIVDIEKNELIFESLSKEKLGIEDLSAGEKELFHRAIYLNAQELQDSIILVDEPELSLHPTWQTYIADLYNNAGENNQVFLATHSPHIISSINPENIFAFYINEDNKKLEVVNVGKIGKHTKGVEPNRILKDIMQMDTIRNFDIQNKIDYVANNFTIVC